MVPACYLSPGARMTEPASPFDLEEHRGGLRPTPAGFQLLRPLGRGGEGTVYLARDLTLQRLVAIKRIDREALTSEAMLQEARSIASLSHPNIVKIHQCQTTESFVFLVMEFLPGVDLSPRTVKRLSNQSLISIIGQIASAIEHAHGEGIIHCDLKPENVRLLADLSPKLLDFGIAKLTGRSTQRIEGTPAYMAPEQWNGGSVGPGTDTWSLSVLCYHLFEGRLPFAPSDLLVSTAERRLPQFNQTPQRLRDLLVSAWTRAEPERPRPASFVDRLLDSKLSDQAASNPFPGMRALQAEESASLLGRQSEVTELLEILRGHNLISVLGQSGVGKTSFLRAGLGEALRIDESADTIYVTPGRNPVSRIRSLTGQAHMQARTRGPTLKETLDGHAAATGRRVVVILDQFEEVEVTSLASERIELIALLVEIASTPYGNVQCVVGLRDDFSRLVVPGSNLFVLRPLDQAVLCEIALRPFLESGIAVPDRQTIADLVADVAATSAPLPLLQFCCRQLWERARLRNDLLDRTTYEEFGGPGGALARHADQVLSGLPPPARSEAKRIVLQLVTPAHTRASLDEPTLRPTKQTHSFDIALGALIAGRILTRTDSSPNDPDGPKLMLTHEAIIQNWPRLNIWLTNARDGHAALSYIIDAQSFWRRHDRHENLLLQPDRLPPQEFLDELSPSPEICDYIKKSRDHHLGRRRRSSRLRFLVAAGALITTVGATTTAFKFRAIAEESQRQAREIRTAASDLGSVRIAIEPVQFDGGTHTWGAAPFEPFELSIHDATKSSTTPGPARAGVRKLQISDSVYRFETRGGPAWLRLDWQTSSCSSRWLSLRSLPGFKDRTSERSITIPMPVCNGGSEVAYVPAGRFVRYGPGSRSLENQPDIPRTTPYLPAFSIGRFEVSNGEYALLAGLSHVSDVTPPTYPTSALFLSARRPRAPVAMVDYADAQKFCLFQGMVLPTADEWMKAARGPLGSLDPDRVFPWGNQVHEQFANLRNPPGQEDGPVPVGSFPLGASPYGVEDLVGNLQEWTSSIDPTTPPLRIVKGGNYLSNPTAHRYSISFDNARQPSYSDYGIGLRCVTSTRTTRRPL